MYALSNTVMSLNGVSSTVFPNTLNGLDSLDLTSLTINGQQLASLFVPYTGAQSNVDLNSKSLVGVNGITCAAVTASGLVQSQNVTATALTTTNTLKINSVPAGTQHQLLAVDSSGNVINGTAPVPTTVTITATTGATTYYPSFLANTSGGTQTIYTDNTFQTISYETGTRTLTTYQLKLLNVPAGTQTSILAIDSAGNVIQGTAPAPTQLLTTAIPAGSISYWPTLISNQATGTKSYFNENSANTSNMYFQAPVLTSGQGTWYIPQLVINTAITLYNARFSVTPTVVLIAGVSYALGLNATNDVVAYVPSNQTAVTATIVNADFNLLFTATSISDPNITLNIDSGTNLKYNPATDTLTVPNLTVGTAATINAANLTGVPTAPTAAPGTNTTQLATTGFVTTAVASSNPNVTATSTNASYYPVFVDSLGTGVKSLYQDTVAADFNYNPSTNLLTVGNLAVNGTIGGANTMNLIQGATSLMTLSTMNIFPQFPVISAYGGMGAVPAVAFDGNGGTGGRFLLKQSTTVLFPVGFGIDSGNEMWISNRGANFNFYNDGVLSATVTSAGGLILGSGQPLGGLNINTQASTQSIRMGWSNLASMTNSGFYNIGIGYLQAPLVTSGYDNIMIGRESFPILTTGNNNIGIGFGNGTQITTGYYNIYIGTGASGSIGGTANTNEVVIGANTVGNGTNTVTLGGTDTTGLYLSAGSDCFYRASRTDHGIKLGSMFDFASAGGWDNSNALFVSTGGMGGNNNGIGMGYNSVAGVGQLVCLAPNVSWQPIRYKASSHVFQASGNSTIMTVSTARVKVDDVELAVRSQTAGQIRMIWEETGYGAFFRNDNGAFYLLLTAIGDPYGAWNTLRPFYVNIVSGMLHSNNGQTFIGGTDTDYLTFGGTGRGITTANGASYGNVSVYGTGINSWNGYDLNKRWTLMANDSVSMCGFHDKNYTWQWRVINNTYYLTCPTIVFEQTPQQSYQPYQVLIGSNGNSLQWGVIYSAFYKNNNVSWNTGVAIAYFTKASATSVLRCSGAGSYYVTGAGGYNTAVNFYNTDTNVAYILNFTQFTNNASNHVSFPIMAQYAGLPAGNYAIIVSTNGTTDGNDHLYLLSEICFG